MYYQPYSYQPIDMRSRQQQLLKDIEKAVNDEFQAVQYYTRLAELTPQQQVRSSILAIRQDEIRHFHQFSNAFYKLSGRYPNLLLNVTLPSNFNDGVRHSITEEQATVPFYQTIASQLTSTRMKEHFLRAANDEHRHAQIFTQMASGH